MAQLLSRLACMSDEHEHAAVFVGRIEGEYGGSYPLYWCRDCGTLIEIFSSSRAVMSPTMWEAQVKNAKTRFTSEKLPAKKGKSRKAGRALGRGLIEISTSQSLMKKLPGF